MDRMPRFKYVDQAITVHAIAVDLEHTVQVVGEPDMGVYEWVIRHELRGVVANSDDGYGSPEVALRDALIYHLGLPDQSRLHALGAS